MYFQIEASVEVVSPVIERIESETVRPGGECLVEEEYTVGVPLVSTQLSEPRHEKTHCMCFRFPNLPLFNVRTALRRPEFQEVALKRP